MGDPTLPCPTCGPLTCSIGDLLPNGSLSGLNCASWTMGESCSVTHVEGCQAANETSGTLTCVYNEVACDVVLEVERQKCLPVVCSLDDPSTGVSHKCRNIPYQGSCMLPRLGSMKLMGIFQQLPCVAVRRVNLSARHKLCIRRVRRCSALTL